jgi:hypothetical protein
MENTMGHRPQEGLYAELLQGLMARIGIASRRFAVASFLYRFPIDFIFFRSKTTPFVMPAKAGIPLFGGCLDSRLRGNDENLLRIGITSLWLVGGRGDCALDCPQVTLTK